ncbi:MAG: peptidyl-prolyl cis-trans isomerase [Bacteroidales bacterium]|nr:peptidyl-prolyl cis-trans isomerase [Bacteroidales bacterium]MBR2606409.1 peptidyl-prolyl cis-trans isomerase [Bacteroidaceae bacterium]
MKLKQILLLLVAMFVWTSCGNKIDHGGKTPLVGVGEDFLYQEDVEQMLASDRMIKDSAEFVKKYIEHWLEDILLYNQAKRNVASSKDIIRLIDNYKKSLLLNIYQERLVTQQLDKEILPGEIEAFYESNKSMFKMEEPMIKGLLLKVSKKAPKLDAVRRWCKSSDPEELEKLEKYTLTNAQAYEYFYDTWTSVSVIAPKVSLGEDELHRKVSEKKMVEFSDSASVYLINVTDYLPVGGFKPLDLAENEIKELLVNSRKAEFLQRVKRDIYDKALKSGDVIFYNNGQTSE